MTGINFEYRSGILEAAAPALDVEWCWYRGDEVITVVVAGVDAPSLEVCAGLTLAEVKAHIRADAKRRS